MPMNGLQFGNFRPALIVESEQSRRIGHQDLLQFRIVRRVAVEQFEQVCVVRRLHGRYVIGRQVSELALARQSRSPLLVAAEPYLAKVSAQLGDTLFLTVRTGLDTLCVARRIGSYPIQVLSIEVGARRPLGVSSAGVAILAALPAPDVRKIVAANQVRFKSYRTGAPAVLGQIQAARRRGYELRDIGLVPGTKSLSAWIRGPDGEPAAAITISAVRHRLNPRREPEVAETLLDAAHAVERAISAAK